MSVELSRKLLDIISENSQPQQLDEGMIADKLKQLISKLQQTPMIAKHLDAAKKQLPQIVAAAQHAHSGKELLSAVGANPVQEGFGNVLAGAGLAGLGGSLIAMLAEFAMRSYISMGSPSYEQLTHDQGMGFLLLSGFALVGAAGIAIGAQKALDN